MDFLQFLKNVEPRYREKQLRLAVFSEYKADFQEITTICKIEREKYADEVKIVPFTIKDKQKSSDGSVKWLLENETKNPIETVLMRFKDGRNTVCISSQSGCSLGCAFCATGKLGFKCNLTAWEIISQVLLASRELKPEGQKLSNVVFMGMGEPLLNLNNVLSAIEELESSNGFGLGARHITVSTSGPIENLKNFIAAKTRTTLAISLHASGQILRERLMPISKVNHLDKLFRVLDEYTEESGRRISYEYVMLRGVNDRLKDAHELGQLLKGRLAHVNLIVFNQVPGIEFEPSENYVVKNFQEIVESYHVPVTRRVSLGGEIAAACGQLAGNGVSPVQNK